MQLKSSDTFKYKIISFKIMQVYDIFFNVTYECFALALRRKLDSHPPNTTTMGLDLWLQVNYYYSSSSQQDSSHLDVRC